MALTAVPVVVSDGVITITDGAGTPLSFVVAYEDGDLAISGLTESQKEIQEFYDRGMFVGLRAVKQMPIEFSFSAILVNLRGDGTTAGIEDVVNRKGVWASATSTLPAAAGGTECYCVQVKWQFERSDFGDTVGDRSITLKYCRLTLDVSEGIPGKISIKGRAFTYSTDYLTVV